MRRDVLEAAILQLVTEQMLTPAAVDRFTQKFQDAVKQFGRAKISARCGMPRGN